MAQLINKNGMHIQVHTLNECITGNLHVNEDYEEIKFLYKINK